MSSFTDTKPQKLTNRIRQDILTSRLQPGEPLPSIRSLMTTDGVSKGTVVRALKLLSETGLVDHHPCRGYIVSTGEMEPKKSRVSQIVLVSLALDRDLMPYYQGLCQALEHQKEFLPGVFGGNAWAAVYPELVSRVLNMEPAGLVLNVVPDEIAKLDIQELQSSRIPMVFMGTGCDAVRRDRVIIPAQMIAQSMVRYALEKGYRDFGILTSGPNSDENTWIDSAQASLQQAGVTVQAPHIIRAKVIHGYSQSPDPLIDMQEAVSLSLAQGVRPRVLIASHDYPAYAAMRAIRQANLRVPEDVAVISGSSCYALDADPSLPKLTTFASHRPLMGEVAGKLLLERIKNPDMPICVHHLPIELLVGQSG